MSAKTSFALLVSAAVGLSAAAFEAAVWRGETAYVDIPAEAAEAMRPLHGAAQDGVTLALAHYDDVAYETQPGGGGRRTRPDVLRVWGARDAAGGKAPAVVRIAASPEATAGRTVFGPLELTVVDRVLPPAKDWRYFLDLWQHPWAVARFFGVAPFSPEHYAKMEPVWRALADCGCKALTVTLLDLPWNHQCYDGYRSMIGRVRRADGTWTFDYSLFDDYVAFGRRCGLGPDIACYTMCPWGYRATWRDERDAGAAPVERREELRPGTPAFDDYWGAFLVDFAAHLKAKGWFDDAFIAMDERSPADVRAIASLVRAKAPGLKISMCGNTSPARFAGIPIDNFSLGLVYLLQEPAFLDELAPRRAAGFKTTFYVCCTEAHPNTFMESPADEAFWLGASPALAGFDGFLRWTANSWPADPYADASFKTANWKAGDTFLIYPGGELSSRLVALRAGVVAAEKMRILKEAGRGEMTDGARAGLPVDYTAFRRAVEAFVNIGLSNRNDTL